MQQMIAEQRTAEIILVAARKPLPRVTGEDSIIAKTLAAARAFPATAARGRTVGLRMNELSLLDFFAKSVTVENIPPAVVRLDFPPSVSSAKPCCQRILLHRSGISSEHLTDS